MSRGRDSDGPVMNSDGLDAPPTNQLVVRDEYGDDPEAELDEDEVLPPEDFEDKWAFISYVMQIYQEDYDADKHNIDEAREDLRFIYVDQWDPETREAREKAGRPCMTVNTLPQFIGQVVGDRRLNRTSVKVVADKQGTAEVARIRSGLIKSIEQYSKADRIYDQCCEDQVGCGVSNFEVTLEYSVNDVFTQDIFIRGLTDPFAVVWDRYSKDPTGRDARRCIIQETLEKSDYEAMFPGKQVPSAGSLPDDAYVNFADWFEGDDVKIVQFWRMIEKDALFALMQDGQVEDVTGLDPETYMGRVYIDEQTGEPYIKEGVRTYAQRYLMTSFDLLEGPYELPLSRLPIIKVSGRIGRVGTRQYRFGLIRWARDPISLRNYWRSVAAETLAMAPKAQWISEAASVKGREEDFREAHLTGDPLLVYNTGKPAPTRVEQPQPPNAILQEANINTQDIKDVTGLHDASLGIRSNEVSGKAILARQREGDVATVTYHDHLNDAIGEGGSVANELIPLAYDTKRVIRIVGADDAEEFMPINDPNDANAPDITQGKYDTKVITGPSFTTQRQEGAEFMLEMIKVNPALFDVAGDILVESQDVPGAERLAKRLRGIIPAAQQEEQEKQQQENPDAPPPPPSPEEQAAMAQQEQALQLQQAQVEAQLQEMQMKLQEQEAKTAAALAAAEKAAADVIKANADARKAEADARKAEADAIIAEEEISFQRSHRTLDLLEKSQPPQPPRDSSNRGGASRRGVRPRSKSKGKTQ